MNVAVASGSVSTFTREEVVTHIHTADTSGGPGESFLFYLRFKPYVPRKLFSWRMGRNVI